MVLNNATDIRLGSTQVSAVYLGQTKIWPSTPTPVHDYSQDYLTFHITTGGNIWFNTTASDNSFTKTIQYSKDNGSTWTSITSQYNGGAVISVNQGDKLLLKGTNTQYADPINQYITKFYKPVSTGAEFSISGNIMSLIYGDNFVNHTTLSDTYTFKGIFEQSGAWNAENLVLPAMTLSEGCYEMMFYGCTLLEAPPKVLPATTLAESCYYGMFESCDNLIAAPQINATTLDDYCCQLMFAYCTSLTTAPDLISTSLKNDCYMMMFYGCTSLNYVKCIATLNLNSSSNTHEWLNGVAASGTFVKDANASWTTGTSGIPSGWTIVNNE